MTEKRGLNQLTPDVQIDGAEVDSPVAANLMRKRKKSRNDAPTQLCGVIASVEVTNFMSHGHFLIELGPKINYITGHNGSGKSAVLTALTVCLGARANTTNRSTNLTGFIKHGKQRTDIKVSFHNCNDPNTGLDAYEHEKYGDIITVHRSITATGSVDLKIKGQNGKVVATKREDLTKILDHFCYQIGNPLSILNQETARTFLGKTDPRELYGLYAKGVKYEQLGNDYDLMHENMVQSFFDLKQSKDGVKAAKEENRKFQDIYHKYEKYKNIMENIQLMKSKIAWASVENGKLQIDHAKKDLEDLTQKLDNYGLADEEVRSALEKFKQELEESKNDRNEKERLQIIRKQAYDEKKEEVKRLEDKCGSLSADQRKLKQDIKDLEEGENDYCKKIKQTEQQLLESNDSQNKEYQAQIDLLTSKKADIIIKVNEIQSKEVEENLKKVSTTEELVTLNMTIEKLRTQKEDYDSQLSNLRSIKKDDFMSRFPPNTGKIIEIIKSEKRFSKTPYGPLGSYITLKNEKWRPLLDALFSSKLSSFAVESEEDKVLLNSIFAKYNYRADVIKRNNDNFDYQSGLPDARYTTILDVLSFSDDYVKRLFIDFNHIESQILVNDRIEGEREMYRNPRNVKAAYACSSDNRSYYKIGGEVAGSSTSSSRRMPYTNVSKMKSLSNDDNKEQDLLKSVERRYQEVKSLFNEKLLSRGQLEVVIKEADMLTARLAKESRVLKNKIRLFDQQIEDLNTRLKDNLDTIIIARIDNYKEELETLRSSLNSRRSDFVNINEEIESCNQERDIDNEELQALLQETEAASQAVTKSSQEVLRLNEEVETLNLRINHLGEKRRLITADIAEKQNNIQDMQKELDEIEVQVRQYYPEKVSLDSGESIATLEANINGLNEVTKRNELSDLTKAANDLQESNARLEEAKALRMDKKRIAAELKPLREAHTQRIEVLQRKQESDKLKLSLSFRDTLSIRNMTGTITLDTENKLLITNVQPTKAITGNSNGVVLDNKSLSGGEKSFTQISLLLSVWDLMQSRFYALDEFDVFMDPVNRKLSIQVLVEAIKKKDCQVILITPQAMSEAKLGNEVKIHKIADPRRQTT